MILYQSNVDRKFAIALDKFLSPIKWVNQPVARPLATLLPTDTSRFLGQYGD